MCTELFCADGTVIESCGELRAAGYDVPPEWEHDTNWTADDMCLCNVDVLEVLAQKPERRWKWDPFGYHEVKAR